MALAISHFRLYPCVFYPFTGFSLLQGVPYHNSRAAFKSVPRFQQFLSRLAELGTGRMTATQGRDEDCSTRAFNLAASLMRRRKTRISGGSTCHQRILKASTRPSKKLE
ncbi:hypothetical protein D9613_003595 [Agrocybe pediades]|uniref:Uncharacterized protein n=1 Tax=Agrocybe pediades TaxID=84607 RepID=A0A8H4QIJ9_9AGAR|nr:hypothetical protein D9613_003595 [Agrocybe pediades]